MTNIHLKYYKAKEPMTTPGKAASGYEGVVIFYAQTNPFDLGGVFL